MNKERRINMRMSERDYEIIRKKAELLDMTISEYIRVSAVFKPVKGFKLSDIAEETDVNLNIAEKGKNVVIRRK